VLRLIQQLLALGLSGLMLYGFWFATPARDGWLWLLAGIPAWMLLRWRVMGRPWPPSPLNGWMLALVGLGLLNIALAPFNRAPGDPLYAYTIIFARVWLGLMLVWCLTDLASWRGSMRLPLILVAVMALGLGLLALGSTAWNDKALPLAALTDGLPRWGEALRPLEAASLNANEIAGGLALLTPLLFGVAVALGSHPSQPVASFYALKTDVRCATKPSPPAPLPSPQTAGRGEPDAYFHHWGRMRFSLPGVAAALIMGLLLLMAILGQSRFALMGILAAMTLLLPWLFSRWWMRGAVWACALSLIAVQAYLILGVAGPPRPSTLNQRDTESWSIRLEMWSSALAITRAYPLTGAGANMYRDGRVRALFPAPAFPDNAPPHAHNAWLQMSADMGLPGLIAFIGLQASAGWMLWAIWRRGETGARAVALGVGGGLLAHALYSVGDAVPLWDRLAFVYWLLLGLGAAQYCLVTNRSAALENRDPAAVEP
jgi:hypothetical protein